MNKRISLWFQHRGGHAFRASAAAILAGTMLTAAGCGTDAVNVPSATAEPSAPAASAGLKVPDKLSLAAGAEHTLKIDGASDTSGIVFQSNRPELVEVDSRGVLRVSAKATAGATAVIITKSGSQEYRTTVTVTSAAASTAPSTSPSVVPSPSASAKPADKADVVTVANAEDALVIVNKQRRLPEGYVPPDLTEPDVPFSFKGKNERRFLRKAAAEALEKLFAAAKEDKIELVAVSGYRSQGTQKQLFEGYIKSQGEKLARQYSAEPGHSEHQTGLAMDVSSNSAGLQLEEKFASTEEGKWLAKHAHEHGFIIRYPKGKESITGYNYEPWHLRYVGVDIAREISEDGLTMEEYFKDSLPVSGKS